jgi:hypothetical protein
VGVPIRIASLAYALIEGVIMAAGGGLIFKAWYFDARSRIYRKLARLPRTPVGGVTENELVRVVGLVKNLEHQVVAPISGTHCVYWDVTIESKHDGKWMQVVHESHGTPFLLADDPAYVIVDPREADITTKHLRYLPQLQPDLFLDRYLTKHDLLHRKHAVRIREMRIELGETFTIMGVGVGDRDPLAAQPDGYRAERTTCFRFAGSKRYPLVISDDPTLR